MSLLRRPTRSLVAISALSAVLLAVGSYASAPAADGSERPSAGSGAPARINLTEAVDGTRRLIVSGVVFAPDGETPVSGVTLYVYQTDQTGRYHGPGESNPRLRGWMTTDAEGRYEYRTIRPASYPNSRIPAHVHTQLWGAGYPPQWGTDLEFADDPLLTERRRAESRAAGKFASVCAPSRGEQGELRCTHHLRLKPTGDRFEPSTRHGFEP